MKYSLLNKASTKCFYHFDVLTNLDIRKNFAGRQSFKTQISSFRVHLLIIHSYTQRFLSSKQFIQKCFVFIRPP